MEYSVFVIASMFEYIGLFIFMFTLFRFRLDKRFISIVILVALLVSQVSYFTRKVPEIGDLSTYLQFTLFVIVLWLFFRVPLFHSLLMNFAGIAASFAIGAISVGIAYLIGVQIEQIHASYLLTAFMQILSFTFYIALARTIFIMNWGFDFVPTSRRSNVVIRGTNAILLAIIAFGIVVAVIISLLFKSDFDQYVFVAGIVFLLTLPIFLYYSLRKDNEDVA